MASTDQALACLNKYYIIGTMDQRKRALAEVLREYEPLVQGVSTARLEAMRAFTIHDYASTIIKAGADPDDVITKITLLLG